MTKWKVKPFLGRNELHLRDVTPLEVHAHNRSDARKTASDLLHNKSISFDRLEVERVK